MKASAWGVRGDGKAMVMQSHEATRRVETFGDKGEGGDGAGELGERTGGSQVAEEERREPAAPPTAATGGLLGGHPAPRPRPQTPLSPLGPAPATGHAPALT